MQSEQQLLRRPTSGNRLKFRRLGKTDKRFHDLGEPTNFGIEADSPGNVEVTADKLWEPLGDQPWRHLSGVIDRLNGRPLSACPILLVIRAG